MYKLNQKQTIILISLIALVVIAVCYYIYSKDDNYEEIQIEEKLKTESISKDAENLATESTDNKIDESIIVHVSGAVNKEGIVKLPKKSRVVDAIEEAGGFKEDAYTKDINLAYEIEDGTKIYVPYNKEKEENTTIITYQNYEKEEYITTKEDTSTKENKNAKININKATQTQLETLPGIGPSTALKIINYRNENGNFKNVEDLKNVSGIGESKYKNIKDLIII